MFSSPPSAVRRRRSASVLGAFAVAGVLLLSPAIATASGTPAIAVVDESSSAAAADSALTMTGTEFTAGDELRIAYSTDQPHQLNWIGIYAAGEQPGDVSSTLWQYAAAAEGEAVFTLDLSAGEYDIWFLAQDGYDALAGPYTVSVATEPGAPQPGDPDAPVVSTPVATDIATDGVIAREGFRADAAPDGWEIETDADENSEAYRGWTFTDRADWTSSVDEMRGRFARPLGAFAVADAQQFGGALDTTLTSAPVAVEGLASVRLTFDSHYRGASGQSGIVRVKFDGGESQEVLRLDSDSVADGYDARQMNYVQDVSVEVPDGASEAVFSWQFTAPDGARYWAIDSVTVHQVHNGTDAVPTQAWVMSDIQGHPGDLQHALGDYSEIAPGADAMMMVGDIVDTGTSAQWQEIYDVMDATADIRPRQTIAAIGNHERYAAGGFEANRDRFLEFAERDKVWDEYIVEGPAGDLPVIVLGQEFASPSDVAMSDAQVEFLEERLAHWTELDSQVVVITHFPLGDTVSASWIPGYHRHHQMNDRLTNIFGNYPNAVLLTGHTHYPAELGDWAAQRRTANGHPDGFWAVNTLAMHVGWDAVGENTRGIREVTTGDINQGLTVDSYGDRIVVTAYDFAADEELRRVEIPNPLVEFDADVLPALNAGVPSVSGDAVAHGTVTALPGDWEDGVELSYQWLVDGAPVDGAVEASFEIGAELVGTELSVTVSGTKPRFVSAQATSQPVTVAAATPQPADPVAPPEDQAPSPDGQPAAGPDGDTGAEDLAVTGAEISWAIVLGALLLVTTGVVLTMRRRRASN